MAKKNDTEEIGPEDGTVEMDREAMMRRLKKKQHEINDATTERVKTLGNDDSVETQSIAVPAELIQATMDTASTWAPKTIDIPLEPVPFEIEEYEANTVSESTQTTQPLGPVTHLDLVAMIDEKGCIQLPAQLVKTPGFRPGEMVKIRIETMEE